MTGRLYVGTSGFAYREWRPEFYPADLKDRDMLAYYSARFPSVEINATFYRAPSEKTLRAWSEQTPESFTLSLKAPQRITHIARLREVAEPLSAFLATARVLEGRLGCVLFQCPPSLRRDDDLLQEFLAQLPGEPFRFALEFRHPSWDEAEVRAALAANGIAWCIADTPERDAVVHQTARAFVYLRLRKIDYDDQGLTRWARVVRAAREGGADAYVYFKHEDDPSGVRFARRLAELVED